MSVSSPISTPQTSSLHMSWQGGWGGAQKTLECEEVPQFPVVLAALCSSQQQGWGSPWWPILGSVAGQLWEKTTSQGSWSLRAISTTCSVKTSRWPLLHLAIATLARWLHFIHRTLRSREWGDCPEPGTAAPIYYAALPLSERVCSKVPLLVLVRILSLGC